MRRNGAKWSMAPSVCNLSVTSAFTFSINTSNFAWVLRWEEAVIAYQVLYVGLIWPARVRGERKLMSPGSGSLRMFALPQ